RSFNGFRRCCHVPCGRFVRVDSLHALRTAAGVLLSRRELVWRQLRRHARALSRSATPPVWFLCRQNDRLLRRDRAFCRDGRFWPPRSEEHTSELQSPYDLVCRLLLEKKKKIKSALLTRP